MDEGRSRVSRRCRSCGGSDLDIFYECPTVPVQSCVVVASPQAADDYPLGAIELAFCRSCGFIQNVAFDPSLIDYSAPAEESQSFSPTFSGFARNLAQCLIDHHGLHGKFTVDIGSGKGDFLYLLSELGHNFGVGIDPGYVSGRLRGEAAERLSFIVERYSEEHLALSADLICCRHTLEHIQPVRDFVGMVHRAALQPKKPPVFFELPDVRRVLKEGAFWDIYYEHCSYFSAGSLARLFRACGFQLLNVRRAYEGQYLMLEAWAEEKTRSGLANPEDCEFGARADEETIVELAQDAHDFSTTAAGVMDFWRDQFQHFSHAGLRVVLWGGGSKAVGFVTTLGVKHQVDCVVDINVHKQSFYLPGTRLEIVAPESLKKRKPDVVIVMNPAYVDEIRQSLDILAVGARLLTV